jgi:hypothetical protein
MPRKVDVSADTEVVIEATPPADAANRPIIGVADKVMGYLFILPMSYDLKKCKTIGGLLDAGCVLLDRDFAITVKKGD